VKREQLAQALMRNLWLWLPAWMLLVVLAGRAFGRWLLGLA
jgi:hypothetical protein